MAAWSGAPIAAFWRCPAPIARPGCRACSPTTSQSLKDGESRYAAYLTPQGRMITDMNVIARGDRLLLDVPATLAASLRDRLDGLIFSEDVQVTDESATLVGVDRDPQGRLRRRHRRDAARRSSRR